MLTMIVRLATNRTAADAAGGEPRHAQVPAEAPRQDHRVPRAQPHAHVQPGHRLRADHHVGGHRVVQPGAGHDAAEPRRRVPPQQRRAHLHLMIRPPPPSRR